MVSIGSIILHLLQNVSVFALVAAAYAAIIRHGSFPPIARNAAIGSVFGIGALVAMSLNITIAPDVGIDGRSVMTGLVGVFGGPVATCITVASVALYRLWLGGVGVSTSIIAAICSGVLGLIFAFLRTRRIIDIDIPALLCLGVAVISQQFLWFPFQHPDSTEMLTLEVLVPVYVVVPLAMALLGIVLHREDQRLTLQARYHEQSELFQAIFNSMSEGVIVMNDQGQTLLANPMSVAITGAQSDRVHLGQWAEEFGLFMPDGKTVFPTEQLPIVRAARGEETNNVEMFVRDATTRQLRLISVSGRPLRDSAGAVKGGVVVCRDISEQRDIQENLRRSEERFALAIDGSQDGIWDYNPVTEVVWFSPRFKEMLGYRDDEFPNDIQFWKSRMLPEDHAASTVQFFEYEAGKCDSIDLIQRYHHKDGHLIYLNNRATGIWGEDGKIHRLVGAATDITSQKQRENELAELLAQLTQSQAEAKYAHDQMARSSNLLRALTDAMPALVSFVDAEECYAYCNKAYEDVLDIETETIIGRPVSNFVEADVYQVIKPHMDRALRGIESTFVRSLMIKGERRYIEQRYIPEIHLDGTVGGFYAIGWDITERHHREQNLNTAASTDPLTGLLNRRAMMTALQDESSRWLGQELSGALLYLDIDRFKPVNDTMGHDAGDEVLKVFAERIRNVVRTTDKVARLGGDEFVILLTARDGAETASRIAKTLQDSMRRPICYSGSEISLTVSIGIALIEHSGPTPEQILKQADMALYEAKAAGRATFRLRTTTCAAMSQSA